MFDEYNVIIVIGSTNCGKSSLVKNTFLTNDFTLCRDIMPYMSNGTIAIIGNYMTGKRRVGTDTVERKQVGNFANQILNLLSNHKQVVLEGMRCVSRPMIRQLVDKTTPLVIFVQCDSNVLFNRATSKDGNTGNPPTLNHIEREIKSCMNFVRDIRQDVDVLTIDSTNITDFSTFGTNQNEYNKLNVVEVTLW